MCLNSWDHETIKQRMSLFPREHEVLVAAAVEAAMREGEETCA